MQIFYNGEALIIKQPELQPLLDEVAPSVTFAVAINGNFVPKSRYLNTSLTEGDQVEILTPMQGG